MLLFLVEGRCVIFLPLYLKAGGFLYERFFKTIIKGATCWNKSKYGIGRGA
jgi:hypothetical protein